MPCDVQTIKTAACDSGISLETNKIKLLQLIAQLLCEAAEGGGSSCFQCLSGVVAPTAPPTTASQPASYENTASGFTYTWNIPTQAWLPVPHVYRALLTQAGTAAPSAVVLENTLGVTLVFARTTTGTYTATASSAAFTAGKTCLSMGVNSDDQLVGFNTRRSSTTVFFIYSDQANLLTDDLLVSTEILVAVYP